MTKRLLQWGMVAALAITLTGCATLAPSNRASINLVDIRPMNSTILETSVQLTLRVTNETNEPLALSGSTHQLIINGAKIAHGTSPEGLTIPPLGNTTIRVSLYLDNLKLLRKFSGGQVPQQIDYRLESRLFSANGGALGVVTDGALDLRPLLSGLSL